MSASLNAILSLARSGLLSQQLALQVTSHNIANANTEGYSRQRAELVTRDPVLFPEGLLGAGVRVADITRARDVHLEAVYRREAALFHGLTTRHEALRNVEAAFGEPGDNSLATTLSAFWGAWADLSNDPSSSSARVAVAARGTQLVDHFGRISASMDVVRSQLAERLSGMADEINRILGEVAVVNGEIAETTASGVSAPDLADRRDALLDELARYAPVDVTHRAGGGVGVALNGISVVEGVTNHTIAVTAPGGVWTATTSSGLTLDLPSGRLGETITVLNDDFTAFRAGLDQLAGGIVERVNAIHVTGTNPLGGTGVLFFEDFGDPTTVTASNLTLSAAVLADSQVIAAGTPDGAGNYQAGENDVALTLAALRDAVGGGILAGLSVDGAYRDLVSDVASGAASAREAEDTHATLLSTARERRESVSGVVTDEELIKVVQIQAAFAAASRLVTVVDEMYQTLLSI